MKTDRELLELAAKAAGLTGYVYEWIKGPNFVVPSNPDDHRSEPITYDWLNDDGDALRLAVDMSIDIKQYGDYVVAWFEGGFIGTGRIQYDGDPCGATRRAIVLAAAAIGGSK